MLLLLFVHYSDYYYMGERLKLEGETENMGF